MGKGKEVLVAFHGYGERSSLFVPIARKIPNRFTVYSVDLPMHGKSGWKGKKIDGQLFSWIIREILKREEQLFCSLMGFSYGGRLALYLTEKVPHLIQNVYLIGPDGIMASGLYRLVQKVPDPLKRMTFRFLVNAQMVRLARSFYKRGWINHHNFRFSEVNFASRQKRRRLLIYWMSMNQVDPKLERVKEKLCEHQISMRVFLGTHDEIIPSRAGRILTDDVGHVEVTFLNANHKKLNKVFFNRIEELLGNGA